VAVEAVERESRRKRKQEKEKAVERESSRKRKQ
jgi:hypothetical protein